MLGKNKLNPAEIAKQICNKYKISFWLATIFSNEPKSKPVGLPFLDHKSLSACWLIIPFRLL